MTGKVNKKKSCRNGLRYFLTLWGLAIFTVAFCKAQQPPPRQSGKTAQSKSNIKWFFETRMDKDNETPLSKAYLLIGNRKILVRDEAMGRYNIVERKDYRVLWM